MTKTEIKLMDKFLFKIGKLKGDLRKNHDNGSFEVWCKKADILNEMRVFVEAMKEIQPEKK
jgi:hypothetical protein